MKRPRVRRDKSKDMKRGMRAVGSPTILRKGGAHVNRKRKNQIDRKRKHKGRNSDA